MSDAESADEIEEAAFAWIARLDRYGRSDERAAELQAWLDAEPRRRGAFLRAHAIWSKLDRASQAQGLDSQRRGGLRLTRRQALAAGAGSLAASLAAAMVLLPEETLETSVGEVRRKPLADGSVAMLNTDTRIKVAMRPHVRRIRIVDGEAWFDVEKNPARPFVVEAGPVRVQAVGTAFSVHRLAAGAEISVTEGVVEAWLVGREKDKVRIEAGQTTRVVQGRPILVAAPAVVQVERRLAWRSGKIDLDGETLAEAAAEFNRYNRRKLTVVSSRLGSQRLYGVFRANDPEGFARSVSLSLGTSMTPGPDEIVIGG